MPVWYVHLTELATLYICNSKIILQIRGQIGRGGCWEWVWVWVGVEVSCIREKNFGYKIVSARYVADHDHEMEVMTGHYKEIAQTRCVSTRGA